MAIKTILFDLDGTLLPMDLNLFVNGYIQKMIDWLTPYGYDPGHLYKSIWQGNRAMVTNDGSVTNEQAFWNTMESIYGNKAKSSMAIFDDFYVEEFSKLQSFCGYQPMAAEIIKTLHSKGYRLILATNPLFPQAATYWRIHWAGLAPEDFHYITTYENSCYCKPNLDYYRELIRKHSLNPEECLMIGNDVTEDMVAKDLGMEVFLITDCLINHSGKDINAYPHGDINALREYISALPDLT